MNRSLHEFKQQENELKGIQHLSKSFSVLKRVEKSQKKYYKFLKPSTYIEASRKPPLGPI